MNKNQLYMWRYTCWFQSENTCLHSPVFLFSAFRLRYIWRSQKMSQGVVSHDARPQFIKQIILISWVWSSVTCVIVVNVKWRLKDVLFLRRHKNPPYRRTSCCKSLVQVATLFVFTRISNETPNLLTPRWWSCSFIQICNWHGNTKNFYLYPQNGAFRSVLSFIFS